MSKEYKVILYGRKTCPYCVKANNILKLIKKEKANISIRYLDIEKSRNQKILENDSRVPANYITVPKIIINDKFIGGFDKLTKYKFK